VVVVDQLQFRSDEDPHHLARNPLSCRVGIFPRGSSVPIVVSQKLIQREQYLGLGDALTPQFLPCPRARKLEATV
jgi:hypothetical protein